MSKWALRVVAIFLGIGALIFAFIGYRLSTSPAPQTSVKPVPSSVVFAVHALQMGVVVKAEDVTVKMLPEQVAGSYVQASEVVGRVARSNVAANSVLLRSQFGVPSNLSALLDPQERAVSIKVDDVVGVGGLLKPNDRVDVMLYMQGNPETASISSAQIVLKNARVLAYGEALAVPADDAAAADDAKKSDDKKTGADNHKSNTTAVLAVPEYELSRFMLAASNGILRLALRPSGATGEARSVSGSPAQQAQYVRLGALAYGDGKRPNTGMAGAGTAQPARPKNVILVYEGGKARAVEVPK